MLLCGFPMVDFIPKLYHNHDITFVSLPSLIDCRVIFLCGGHLLHMILQVGINLNANILIQSSGLYGTELEPS
jgi:hypothetical protein